MLAQGRTWHSKTAAFFCWFISGYSTSQAAWLWVSDTNIYPWDNIHNIQISVSWEGMSRFNNSLSLRVHTLAFLPFHHPFLPDVSWISPWVISVHQSDRKLTQEKGKHCFLLCWQAKTRQGRFWHIPEQARGQGQGPTSGSRRGVDKTSTFINHSKFFAQMTSLANFLHFSCEFVPQLASLMSPLAPLCTGCGLSDLYIQFLSSWASNRKLYRHHTRCWPGISSFYTIVIP